MIWMWRNLVAHLVWDQGVWEFESLHPDKYRRKARKTIESAGRGLLLGIDVTGSIGTGRRGARSTKT